MARPNPPRNLLQPQGERPHKSIVRQVRRENDFATVLTENLLDYSVGNRLNRHNRLLELASGIGQLLGHRRRHPHWMDNTRPHFRRLIPRPQLLRQTLVERHRAGLATAVIRHLADRDERRHTRDRDDVSVVLLHHARQELAHHPEVGHGVDFERLADPLLGLLENGPVEANAGVVHQNSRIPVFGADGCADFLDAR